MSKSESTPPRAPWWRRLWRFLHDPVILALLPVIVSALLLLLIGADS